MRVNHIRFRLDTFVDTPEARLSTPRRFYRPDIRKLKIMLGIAKSISRVGVGT
jgi:hypothetical protein